MVPSMRKWFNDNFTKEKYDAYIKDLNSKYPGSIEFHIAETPLFIDKEFTGKMLSTCESIIDVITQPNFKAITRRAIPTELKVPNESPFPHFIVFDFAICEDGVGGFDPQLIEFQGFPSLFAYQAWHDEAIREHFNIPGNYSAYLNDFNQETYLQLLKEIIVGSYPVENVILLDLLPHQQKTRVDFYFTEEYTGIQTLCLSKLIKEEKKLFYEKGGRKIEIKRIYNRIIFDELKNQSPFLQEKGKLLLEELDAEWVPHPNWFYRISKYTLPFIQHPNVPESIFLDEVTELPEDLENYVLKPLFSLSGKSVVINVTAQDITGITNPQNWILQKKVKYANAIKTPGLPSKAEIRIFYFWKDGEKRPIATSNLARLSKGQAIGTRYNIKDEWVGASQCYFEK